MTQQARLGGIFYERLEQTRKWLLRRAQSRKWLPGLQRAWGLGRYVLVAPTFSRGGHAHVLCGAALKGALSTIVRLISHMIKEHGAYTVSCKSGFGLAFFPSTFSVQHG
jgi:hypothetical protein